MDLIVKSVLKRLAKKKENGQVVKPAVPTEEKPHKSKLKAIAIEFIGGYLKWKAIELTYRGIRYYIRKRRAENEED